MGEVLKMGKFETGQVVCSPASTNIAYFPKIFA